MADSGEASAMPGVDASTPSVARMYDYFLGGKDNYAADRAAAEAVVRALPTVEGVARANRAFLQRAVRHVAGCGIDQFIDIGAGLPTQGNVHEIARAERPGARVVYVDNDPTVIVHARALVATDDRIGIVRADVRDPGKVLDDPEVHRLIDFRRPVCVLFVAILHFLPDEEDPAALVRRFTGALPDGSHVILSHAAAEELRNQAVGDTYRSRSASASLVARTREEVAALLDGLTILDPGVVPLHEWRPRGGEYVTGAGWTAVARKESVSG
ncbi:SAM-dependent methyltransferase [Actinomadura darangshiensis]|uniref:SAM-dependent methyltransferase n=1 Tax=Actinomadura darangshiensis TaxID=705336 RepID=A0A4R5B9L2_9ACTN|nr:SAM-dependent methyltransferase [Actinomadura darangshiensis]TDD81853.1 SAM-dependent methyltransferase [Actinomadura darangshiensis]